MRKKIFVAILSFAMLIPSTTETFVLASYKDNPIEKTVLLDQPDCSGAKSAYLCDYSTGSVIYAKNENDRYPIASMTKIMLLILAFEKESNNEFSFDEIVTVSKNASGMGGSQVFLETKGKYVAEDLIKSIIVASANDSSVAIAEHLYGSENVAVSAMNEQAKKMDLKNTLFSNCTGLMKPTQYSSAKDVAKMLSVLISYPKYFNYSKIYLDELKHSGERKTQLTNTNKLIKYYNGCDGGKTGFTNEAGFCLAATAKRGAMRLISVVLGEESGKARFNDCSKLLDYGFDNYSLKCIIPIDTQDYQMKIACAKNEFVNVIPKNNVYLFGINNSKDDIRIEFEKLSGVKAPIEKGEELGKFVVYVNGIKIGEYAAVSNEDVQKLNYIDYLEKITNS